MKSAISVLCFAGLVLATTAVKSSAEISMDKPANPVSRIVTLLTGLKDKLETDLKAETDLFETYKCWYTSTKTTKEASNEAANSRMDSLKTYIKDIESGKIEFTTERQDLEKQIADLTSEIDNAKTMRTSEEQDYEAGKGEMEAAIKALDKAIITIEDATKGSFAQAKSYIDMLSIRHSVQKAMAFSRGLLDASDAKYLEQLLNGDVPKKDWKKLNRKATHKMKYVKRSGKIIETLKNLKATFKKNLADAIAKEKEAKAAYDKISKSKGDMLETSQKAMKDMAAENGARGVSKADAQNEVDALEAQVKADTKFVKEAKDAFEAKEKEWEARKDIRGKEILAMSQAIAVLASDDAKDTFGDSFKSQGYLLLQEGASQHLVREPERRAKCAARMVSSLAAKSTDPRLALLAKVAKNAAIDKVVKKIDEIVKNLEKEEKSDLDKKQKCENDLSEAASKAKKAALAMDTASEDITRASAQIEEIKGEVKEQEEKKKGLQGQIKDITRQREDENTQYKSDKIADKQALDLVKKAITIIKDWKNAKKAALISVHQSSAPVTPAVAQPTAPEGILPPPVAHAASHHLAATAIKVHTAQHSGKQAPQFVVGEGEAPPPPPPTWESAEYKGAGSEQKGVVGIMTLVKEDIEKDIKSNDGEETQSAKDFQKEKADLEGEIKAVDKTVSAYKKDMSAKEKDVVAKTESRSTKKDELASQVKLYKSYKPGCDFMLVNFVTRTKARQIEIDGLKKAKAILKGANFGKMLLQVTC